MQGSTIKLSADFLSETLEDTVQWAIYSKY